MLTRRLIVLPALVVALSLGFTGAASAQPPTPFQASVTFTGTHNGAGCSNGAYACGTANIAGYGAASWNWYPVPTSNAVAPCDSYVATTYFTLAIGDTLVLGETGNLCGLGHDAAAYRGYFAAGSKD